MKEIYSEHQPMESYLRDIMKESCEDTRFWRGGEVCSVGKTEKGKRLAVNHVIINDIIKEDHLGKIII